MRSAEDIFYFAQQGPAFGAVFNPQAALQFLKNLPLAPIQLGRRLYSDLHEQVALAVPIKYWHSPVADAKRGA